MIVYLSGHYPGDQVKHVRKLALKMMKKHPDLAMIGVPDHHLLLDLGYTGDHAARGETALALAMFPNLVDLTTIPPKLNRIERRKQLGIGGDDPLTPETDVWGQTLKNAFVERLSTRLTNYWATKNREPFFQLYRDIDKAFEEIHKRPKKVD
jgi:hypothetical protein